MAETITIQTYPTNFQCRVYHTRTQLTEKTIEVSGRPDTGSIVDTIAGIRGVTRVTVTRYEVAVWKGAAFDWDEIEPEVLAFLRLFEEAQ